MRDSTTRSRLILTACALCLTVAFVSGAAGQVGSLVFIGNGAVPYVVTEGSASSVTIPVTLNEASSTQVSIDWHTQSAWVQRTASDSGFRIDYLAAGGTVVFAPGQTTKTVTVSIFDDGIAEEDESFVVALSNPVGAQIGMPRDFWTHGAVVTIHDNELGAFIGEGGYTLYADEGDTGTTSFAVPVRLNFASTAPVSVDWETRDDGLASNKATADQDYQAASGTVTFAPGETSKTIDIGIVGDMTQEPDEYFLVSITNVAGARNGVPWDDWAQGATVAIRDNDQAPPPGGQQLDVTVTGAQAFGSSSPTFDHSESLPTGISVTGTLTCTGLSGGAAISPSLAAGSYTIDGSSCSGLSLSGADASGYTLAYIGGSFMVTAPSEVVVTAAGSQSFGSFTPTFDHSESPPVGISVTGTLACTGLSGATAISPSLPVGSYTIDASTCSGLTLSGTGSSNYALTYLGGTFVVRAESELSIDDVTATEGDAGTRLAAFTVTRTNATGALGFDFVTESGTATAPDDYVSTSGSASFAAGAATTTIEVRVVGDVADEPDETFAVRISNASSGTIADDVGVGTIADDDPEPALSIDDVSIPEGDTEKTPATFTVRLSAASAKTVTVDYQTTDGSASAPDDYTAVPTQQVTFLPGTTTHTVAAFVNGDTVHEAVETFTVDLDNAQNATIARGQGVGTIVDDEPAAELSIGDVSVTEGDAGTTTATFTVTRSDVIGAVSFDFATVSATATPGEDFVSSQGTRSFAAGSATATVDVQVSGDVFDEPDETFGVRLSNPVNATIADDFGVGTIVDNDPEPTLSIDDVSVLEGEAGTTTATFTVSLSTASENTIAVAYATTDGTATSPEDYAAVATAQLEFGPRTTTRTLNVTVNGDTLHEADETFSVELSSAENATIADGIGIGTIRDDERPANDDFADATLLAGASVTLDTSRATVEAGEPGLAAGVPNDFPSVWYRLRPGRGNLVLHLEPTTPFPPKQVSVYSGSTLGGLTLVGRADNGAPFPVGFSTHDVDLVVSTAANQTYYVQVLGPAGQPFAPGSGEATLTTSFHAAPANDDFADAASLSGGSAEVDTSYATVEPSEPGLAASTSSEFPSAWYRLSPGRGDIVLHLESTTTDTPKQLSVYTGNSLTGLNSAGRADNSAPFPVGPLTTHDVELVVPTAAGEVYYVQVLGPAALRPGRLFTLGIGAGTLTATFHPAAANDDFAAAATLSIGSAAVDTSFATVEAGEPGVATRIPTEFPSVWYRLSEGQNRVVSLRLASTTANTPKQVSVYTGSVLSGLTLIARADNSPPFPDGLTTTPDVELAVPTLAGHDYYVQVLGPAALRPARQFSPGIGAGTLTMTAQAAPGNDDFANAAALPVGSAAVNTSFATVEAGEPGLATATPNDFPSVWYRLSPGLGTVVLDVAGAGGTGKPRRLIAYTGASLNGLAAVAQSSTPDPFPGAAGDPVTPRLFLQFHSVCGATYYVQTLGPSAFPHLGQSAFDSSAGQATLTEQFQPTPLPPNDAFAAAITLPVGHTTLPDGWWTCSTAQTGEPAHGGAPAAHSLWYVATLASGRATIDSPGNRVAVYQGTNLANLTRVADGGSGSATFLTRGGTYLIAVDGVSGTAIDLSLTPGEVVTGTTLSVTTDNEVPPDGATAADPVETKVSRPAISTAPISIFETQASTAPSAWTFLGWKIEISAPPVTAAAPYTITFTVDGTLFSGVLSTLNVFRNGVAIPNCLSGTAANPDPCVSGRAISGNDRLITVRTSHASEWTLGVPRSTAGTAAGVLKTSSGGDAEFLVASNGTTTGGRFSYGTSDTRYVASTLDALAIDGRHAWFAGVGRDGRPFLVYIEDNGTLGRNDVFRLWIGGVEQTSDGKVAKGDVAVTS
jgi:hypothetical protein